MRSGIHFIFASFFFFFKRAEGSAVVILTDRKENDLKFKLKLAYTCFSLGSEGQRE